MYNLLHVYIIYVVFDLERTTWTIGVSLLLFLFLLLFVDTLCLVYASFFCFGRPSMDENLRPNQYGSSKTVIRKCG